VQQCNKQRFDLGVLESGLVSESNVVRLLGNDVSTEDCWGALDSFPGLWIRSYELSELSTGGRNALATLSGLSCAEQTVVRKSWLTRRNLRHTHLIGTSNIWRHSRAHKYQ